MWVQNLKIIGGRPTQKIWAVPGYAHASFSPKFLMGFCSDGPSEYNGSNMKSVALTVLEIIAIEVFWVELIYTTTQ